MKIFEFYFNPQGRKDQYVKAFSFDWERKKDHTLGTLVVVGELNNALPQNARLLDKLARTIYESYVPSGDFKLALKTANDFLSQEIKMGNVDWLGNLHMSVVTLKRRKDSTTQMFSGARTGALQLFLSRKGALADFKEHLGEARARQGVAKVFSNIVTGKLVPEDKLLLCTPELFEEFSRQNTFQDLAYFMEEKQFQGLFKSKEKELSKNPGLLVSVLIEEITLKKVRQGPLFTLPKFKIPELKIPSVALPSFAVPVLKMPKIPKVQFWLRSNLLQRVTKPKVRPLLSRGLAFPKLSEQGKRRITFILLFLGLLLLGSLLF
ncbi:MAG: hypothetical protein A2842_01240 [Candidatus Wildermuthbacteria bacterium RIFCSPHIGHO2_01_FULL_48_25]|uniref:PPM-type phosphatase domain-containing protein n=1 Tax=Candidatus Wildermuthbacteria bacterium RIFCSPLOWO2_01_FULL_48_16 TaxID=1802461 RepID=A0A1G2RLR3_9BACT|nr:MAG: hypothetical protein A2842_01240 [Candidatus Wildermuthbacteria bacterium RIFCSPHIGHO2_01_FULL_48_25]OHA73805.1 MAG: hypothetical protein A3B24_01840 [Candidatus Wildermuthbacteria bacterium RIFCSPLOWO2_01_FULL_48_16]